MSTTQQRVNIHSVMSSSSPYQSVVLPGVVKKRKAFLCDMETRAVITDYSVALAMFDKLIADGLSPEATFLTLMQRYNISPQALDSIGGK